MAATETTSAYPESWSAVYDLSDIDRRPWLNFYLGLVGPEVRSLLDLGCGTGSMTKELAARMPPGSRITGVDLSPAMIAISKSRMPQFEWLVGNLSDPPVTGKFDLAVVMFNTLQLLLDHADLIRCFRNVADRLTPQGRFAFDIANPNLAWLSKTTRVPEKAELVKDTTGRLLEVRESRGYDPQAQVMDLICYLHDAETGEEVLDPMHQKLKQLFPDDLPRLLAAGGLKLEQRYGDLDGSAFGAASKRQVCVCSLA